MRVLKSIAFASIAPVLAASLITPVQSAAMIMGDYYAWTSFAVCSGVSCQLQLGPKVNEFLNITQISCRIFVPYEIDRMKMEIVRGGAAYAPLYFAVPAPVPNVKFASTTGLMYSFVNSLDYKIGKNDDLTLDIGLKSSVGASLQYGADCTLSARRSAT